MRWDLEAWRKLYRREQGSFALLPLYARALAAELLKFVDDDGRIFIGTREPWEAVSRLCGATAGDRRLLRQHIPMLIEDGYLVRDEQHLRIRNMGNAQGRHRRRTERDAEANEDRTENESATNEERTGNEPARTRNEPETKSDVSPRNDYEPLLVRACASEEEKRSEEKRSEERPAPDLSPATAGAEVQAHEPAPDGAATSPPRLVMPVPLPAVAAGDPATDENRLAVAGRFLPAEDLVGWNIWRILVGSEALRLGEAQDGGAEAGSLARQAHGISSKLQSAALPAEVGLSIADDVVRENDAAYLAAGSVFVPPTMSAVARLSGRYFSAAQKAWKAGTFKARNGSRAPPASRMATTQPAAKPGEHNWLAQKDHEV